MKTIYIQIATIEDQNLIDTVRSAMESASHPDRVSIGIAATVSQGFYESVHDDISKYINVRMKRFDPILDRGLGKGRVNSRFAYDNQDYILQVDAHTLFQRGWDDFLISLHDEAIAETGNPKTLVTGYLGKYSIENGRPVIIDQHTGYSVWSKLDVTPHIPLKNVVIKKISDFPEHALGDRTRRFYPSNRVAGNFIFGDMYWAEFHGWSGMETFWEEEVLPAISLLDHGFSLVFPNMELPLTHRYYGDDLTRQLMNDIFDDQEEITRLANECLNFFIINNEEQCEIYRDYSGYDLATNELTFKVYVPERYTFKEKK